MTGRRQAALNEAPEWMSAEMPPGYQTRLWEIERLSVDLDVMDRIGRVLWETGEPLRDAVGAVFSALKCEVDTTPGPTGPIVVTLGESRRLLLVVSGVYYPTSVLPQWMQWLATISPATYALRGIRAAILGGADVAALWGDIWPLIVIGVVAVPLGLATFRRGERYAKKHGKLKRSG